MNSNVPQELCKNTDCVAVRNDEFTEHCNICSGYYNDDGLNDILFIEEEPNNRKGTCELCRATNNIVQMKDTGQYICQDACDEDDDEDDDDDDDDDEDDDDDDEDD